MWHCGNKLFYFYLLLILQYLQQIRADCNACSITTNVACVSETEFQFCESNSPVGQIYSCSANKVCSLRGACESASTALVACSNCNVCNAKKVFACTGTKNFALCLGSDQVSQITGTCETGYVCDMSSDYICGESTVTAATCSYTDDPVVVTTTPSPDANPALYCEMLGTAGRFPVGVDPTTTCKQYIRCIDNGGTWVGVIYYCPGGNYFDSSTGTCTTTLPSTCSAHVARLNLYNLELY